MTLKWTLLLWTLVEAAPQKEYAVYSRQEDAVDSQKATAPFTVAPAMAWSAEANYNGNHHEPAHYGVGQKPSSQTYASTYYESENDYHDSGIESASGPEESLPQNYYGHQTYVGPNYYEPARDYYSSKGNGPTHSETPTPSQYGGVLGKSYPNYYEPVQGYYASQENGPAYEETATPSHYSMARPNYYEPAEDYYETAVKPHHEPVAAYYVISKGASKDLEDGHSTSSDTIPSFYAY